MQTTVRHKVEIKDDAFWHSRYYYYYYYYYHYYYY